MELKDLFGDFFTQEAGQRRRDWLTGQEQAAADHLRYFLGPHLYPPVTAVTDLAALFSPGQDVIDAHQAGNDLMDWNGALDAAGDVSALVAALGSMMLPGGVSSYRQGFDDLVEEGVKAHKSGRLNIFAGPNSATADLSAHQRAMRLEETGADRDRIFQETGWFRGADGNWRYEIDDSQATVNFPRLQKAGEAPEMYSFDEAIRHDALREAYPALDNVKVFATDGAGYGHTRGEFSGEISDPSSFPTITVNGAATLDPSTFLHEVQHGIQRFEGFADGGVSVKPKPGTPGWDVLEELRKENAQPPIDFEAFFAKSGMGDRKAARSFFDQYITGSPARPESELMRDAARETYLRLGGEVEARNVQKRLGMNAAERRATPPWKTQDRPDEKQILHFYKDRAKASAGPLAELFGRYH